MTSGQSGNSANNNHSILQPTKRKVYIIIGIALGLAFFYLLKGCSKDQLLERNYVIGQDPRWKDIHLKGKERNLAAFNTDLIFSIAKEEDLQMRLKPSSNLLEEIHQGKLQGFLTQLQPSYLNENLIFSDPFFLTGPVLIIHINPRTQQEEERGIRIIGIPENSPLLSSLEYDPAVQVKIYDDFLTALTDLREKKIDGAIFPVITAYLYTEAFYQNELKISTLPLTNEGIRLAVPKNENGAALIEKFNEGLKKIKEDGTYHNLIESWGFMDVERLMNTQAEEADSQ